MKQNKTIYTCDVCLQEKDKKEIYTFKFPMWSKTFKTYGKATVDMCVSCYEQFVKTVRGSD